jgi:Sec-independent protein secretion pathway component TatC
MILFSRALVALIGTLSLLSVFQHWFAVETLVDARGIQTIGAIGAANIRADIGGLFLAIGVFAFIAAWQRSTTWLLATWLLPALALLGRFISLGIDGISARVIEPMVIEAVVLTILGAVYVYWKKLPEGL